ncbi:MAG TPA: Hsp20/alpha crystallin family protein [Candidatus Binatia bacterium]|nr:Hsp20/alpha crystallin family protein [Candidatus Binatia bacterium]
MALERWRPFGTTMSRWEPFRELTEIQQEMNRLFDSFFGRPTSVQAGERLWVPLADMWETRDDLYVAFEVPGVREKDVSVSITGDLLTVKGERKWDKEIKEDSFHRLERVYGRFERAIPLPVPVQADKVKATYRDGVLEIRLPKAEEVKPKEIKIDIL